MDGKWNTVHPTGPVGEITTTPGRGPWRPNAARRRTGSWRREARKHGAPCSTKRTLARRLCRNRRHDRTRHGVPERLLRRAPRRGNEGARSRLWAARRACVGEHGVSPSGAAARGNAASASGGYDDGLGGRLRRWHVVRSASPRTPRAPAAQLLANCMR